MSYSISPFEVSSKALAEPVKVRFVHLYSGIATRHSDTIDCLFLMDGRKVMVAISCAALTELRQREGKHLSDQQLAEIAAQELRRALQAGYDPSQAEVLVDTTRLRVSARELGYL